ncbi:MAG TPA: hypothetical protein VFO70_04375 [Chitinophagaceae bacterium]|nr:hypothetical protein [Chitinophagaceae bacterium]
MKETDFIIVFNMKTTDGFESYAKFYLGNDRRLAEVLFSNLIGTKDVTEDSILYIELMEINKGLPVNLQMLRCTLEELAENCKLITRETFKFHNLEEM